MSTPPLDDGQAARRSGRGAALLALFGSSATLICCALPALLVTLGAGAAMATLVGAVPQLVWFSENKGPVFGGAAALLALAGAFQWRARHAPCPVDPALRDACLRTRRQSARVYGASVLLFAIGGWFAFIQPLIG